MALQRVRRLEIHVPYHPCMLYLPTWMVDFYGKCRSWYNAWMVWVCCGKLLETAKSIELEPGSAFLWIYWHEHHRTINLLACRCKWTLVDFWPIFCNLNIQEDETFNIFSNPIFTNKNTAGVTVVFSFRFFFAPSSGSNGWFPSNQRVREFDAQGLTNLAQSLAKLEMTSKDVMLDALIQVRNEKRAPGYLIRKDPITFSDGAWGV